MRINAPRPLLFLVLVFNNAVYSQIENSQGEIGKPMPAFHLINIKGASLTGLNNTQLKGRFTILDFWNRYCASCIAGFPKTNEIYAEYRDKIDFYLIGDDVNLEQIFDKYKEKWKLAFPHAYDPATFRQFVHAGVPYLIWIDSLGVIKAITTSNDLERENINAFLAGREFVFRDASYKASQSLSQTYDFNKPFLVNGNGGPDTAFEYRSVIAKFRPGMPIRAFETSLNAYSPDNSIQLEGSAGLKTLYTLAYFGVWGWSMDDPIYSQVYNNLIIETRDSVLFKDADFSSGKNIFWYSLIVPPKDKSSSKLMKMMRTELENFFGFNAAIEKRVLPYYKLIITEKAKNAIRTKGGDVTKSREYPGGFDFVNISMKDFLGNLFFSVQNGQVPIIDETGIDFNIDMKIDILASDIRDIKRALHEKGIEMQMAEKEFAVLVIKD